MTKPCRVFTALAMAFAASATSAGAEEKGGTRVTTIVDGNTRFALDLYAKLKGGDGNLFFSPYSISTALAMTTAGARGETARQMASTLHIPDDPASAGAGFAEVVAVVNGKGLPEPRPDTLVTANALWLQTGAAFLPEFLETVTTRYAAALTSLDFADDPAAARDTINGWVQAKTVDKIRDLIGPGVLTRKTSIVVTNAVYFKGAWQSPFRESATRRDAVFHAPGGRDVTVPMMAHTGTFRYFDGGTFQAVELPYRGNARAMVVLLPKEADKLGALEGSLTAENLGGWLRGLGGKRVSVELPRFKLTEQFELSKRLVELGMADAFKPAAADFSGMNGRRDLSISAVVHKAFVDVNEAGTEAAAATAVAVSPSMRAKQVDPIVFRADHPFVVLIRDQATGSILFLGRVFDPNP